MLPKEELFQAQLAVRRLCLYRSIAEDSLVQTAVRLAEFILEDLPLQVLETYHVLTGMLASRGASSRWRCKRSLAGSYP